MTAISVMKVESIAECSIWSILQYFLPALSDNQFRKPFFVFLRFAVLHRFYCTLISSKLFILIQSKLQFTSIPSDKNIIIKFDIMSLDLFQSLNRFCWFLYYELLCYMIVLLYTRAQ